MTTLMPSPPPAPESESVRTIRRRHLWQNFNFWLVTFTAIYSMISLVGLWVAIESARLARQSADAGVATVRAWLDAHSFKFVYSPPGARQQVTPEFTVTLENIGKTPAKALDMTVEFAFDDQSGDKRFEGCPEANLHRVPFMVAGPPGEPWPVLVATVTSAQFATLKSEAGSSASVYAHGCVRYRDVMTDRVRLTEFCVRYFGADNYTMCDNANLME
jgi:hypothetical protein